MIKVYFKSISTIFIVCTPPLRLGELECWKFGFLGEVKIFLILGEGGGFKKFLPASPSFSIFTFLDAGLQVDIDFNIESKFYFQGAVSFYPSSVGTQNEPNP